VPRRLKLTTHAREIKPTLAQAKPTKTEASETVERSQARQIAQLPPDQLEIIVNSLKENTKPGVIANFFAEQGWLTVSEKTFRSYIMAFRRIYPEALRGSGRDGIDKHIDPRKPHLDEEDVIDQAIRVQKLRIGRALDFEANTNLPMKDVHKDIEVLRNLAVTKAELRGGGKQSNKAGSAATLTNEASEALRKSDAAESSADKLTHLTSMLVPLMRQKQNNGT